MTRSQVRSTPKTGPQIIHEYRDAKHRIIVLQSDGTNKASEWASISEIAVLGTLYANASPDNGLPAGVFTTRAIDVQVIL